jgi:hypothetical protein
MSHDVFISYSNKDKTVADAVCAKLEQNKVRCWIAPRDIDAGSEWGESIVHAINGSRAMVLVFSRSANESPQIRREVERAVNKGVIIVPFRIENVIPTKSLEYFMGAVHWLDALTPPIESHLDRLSEIVRRIVFDGGPRKAERLDEHAVESGSGQARPLESARRSKKAIWSLICGLLFLLYPGSFAIALLSGTKNYDLAGKIVWGFFILVIPAGASAVILGHWARREIRRSYGDLKGSKMAMTGLVFGYINVGFVMLGLIMNIVSYFTKP